MSISFLYNHGIWPYNSVFGYYAGFSSKCSAIIKVDPLPEVSVA